MKFRFLKVTAMLSLGLAGMLVSCDKNEEQQEPNVDTFAQSELEFKNLMADLAQDSDVVDVKVIDFNETESLRSGGIVFATDADRRGTIWLAGLKGVYGKDAMSCDHYCYDTQNGVDSNGGYYKKIAVDLNEGAGGAYAYLLYKTTTNVDDAVGQIDGYYNTTSFYAGTQPVLACNDWVNGNTQAYFNANKGTKGAPIYLGVRKGANSKYGIYRLAVVTYKNSKNDYYKGLYKVASDLDLNKGAGGKYIYIYASKCSKADYKKYVLGIK